MVGLAVARRQGLATLPDAEREWLDYRTARDEFDDWITTGRVPEATLPETPSEPDWSRDHGPLAADSGAKTEPGMLATVFGDSTDQSDESRSRSDAGSTDGTDPAGVTTNDEEDVPGGEEGQDGDGDEGNRG